MRDEGQIEIPMNVDTSRYFMGTFRWVDILYTTPFIILSIILIYIMYNLGYLKAGNVAFTVLPPVLVLCLLWIKHPDRKNISLIRQMWWQIKFKKSKKVYEYSKERAEDMKNDIRTQLGIFNIANDCIETLDKRIVKVIEVSSVNLTGMSKNDRNRTLKSYQNFLNSYPPSDFPIQIEQQSKPVNLKSYLNWVHEETGNERNMIKRMLAESYINKANQIQKNKKMVSKARYFIISEKIGVNKEKAISKLSRKSEIMISNLINMIGDKYRINANVLNNEDLFKLIYSSIDYESAQINHEIDLSKNIAFPISMGDTSYQGMQEEWEETKQRKIL